MSDLDFFAESLGSCTTHTAAVIWLDRSFSCKRLLMIRHGLVDVSLLLQHWLLLLLEVVIKCFWVSIRRRVSLHFLWKRLKTWEPLGAAIKILEWPSWLLVCSHVLVVEILIHVRHLKLLGIHETLLIELLSKRLDYVWLIAARIICCIMWKWRRADLRSWIEAPDRALSILLVSIHGSLITGKHRFLDYWSLTTGVKGAWVLKEWLSHLGSKVRMMLLQGRLIASLPAQMHIHWIELETWWITLGLRLGWFEMRKKVLLVLNKWRLNLLLIILENKIIANQLSVHFWKRGLLMDHAYVS